MSLPILRPPRRALLGFMAAAAAGPALAQSGARAPDAPGQGAPQVAAHRVEVPGAGGAVSAGHPLAAMAGARMLMRGGRAADAVVAAMAVLAVVEPWASGPGGNGFATTFERRTGRVRSLAFAGPAPKGLPADVGADDLDVGPMAAAVPGAFAGWIALAAELGRLSLKELLAPAIAYARDGHPLDPSIAATIARQASVLRRYPTTAAVFLPAGAPPAPRAVFRNPDLARTFEALVAAEQAAIAGGADRRRGLQAAHDYFYSGPLADRIDAFHRRAGGALRKSDLQAFRATWQAPLRTSYRGREVWSTPPTSRGGLELLLQLNLMEGFDLAAHPAGTAPALHLMIECVKLAKSDIYPWVADPSVSPTPVAGLLDKRFAARRRGLIRPDAALPYPEPGDPWAFDPGRRPAPRPLAALADERTRGGDTTSLSAIDADGDVVACTPTLGGGFGTNVVVGDTGMLFNNGMRAGSTAPYAGHPNAPRAGQTPILNNSPTIVLRNGGFELAFGSPGGETIGQSEFQFLLNLIDHEMSLQAAIEAPRFAVEADPSFYRAGAGLTVNLEARASPEALAQLRAVGHRVQPVGAYAIGSIQAIRAFEPGVVFAGADPRRMGYAVGL